MTAPVAPASPGGIVYPESDGLPMSDNTRQFRWIVVLYGNLAALSFFAIPAGNMAVFPILVAAAFAWRRQAEAHKRLMLLAIISVLDAAVARWPIAIMAQGPVAFFAVTDLYILAGVVFDMTLRRRVHPAYIWVGLLIVGSQIGRLVVWRSAAWLACARMFAA